MLLHADFLFRRVLDAESGVYYYANIFSGETSWTKSAVYLHASSEPPIILGEEIAAASAAASYSNSVKGSSLTTNSSARYDTSSLASINASNADADNGVGESEVAKAPAGAAAPDIRRSPRYNRII